MHFRWTVHCNDEGIDFEVWSPSAPTTCPNSQAHTVVATSDAVPPSCVDFIGHSMAYDRFHLMKNGNVFSVEINETEDGLTITKVT